jgi:hypothetical protein
LWSPGTNFPEKWLHFIQEAALALQNSGMAFILIPIEPAYGADFLLRVLKKTSFTERRLKFRETVHPKILGYV